MTARLTSAFLVRAMLRRVHDAGGSGVVLNRGDDQAGAILVMTLERGSNPRGYERGIGPDGRIALIRAGPEGDDSQIIDYWQRRVLRDPDLWVIELDIADAERFAAETILAD